MAGNTAITQFAISGGPHILVQCVAVNIIFWKLLSLSCRQVSHITNLFFIAHQ